LTEKAKKQDGKATQGKGEKKSSRRSSRTRRSVADGFYAEKFTSDELADLSSKANAGDLDDEIDLLKVVIRRKLAEKKAKADSGAGGQPEDRTEKEVDFEAIRRFVDTLCRAVKIQYSLSGKGTDSMENAMGTTLTEIFNELGMSIEGIVSIE